MQAKGWLTLVGGRQGGGCCAGAWAIDQLIAWALQKGQKVVDVGVMGAHGERRAR